MTRRQWPTVKLGDVAEIASGGTPKTSDPEYWGGDIPWITPADMSGLEEFGIRKGAKCITAAGLKNSSAKVLPPGTVILSSRAPIGHVAIALESLTTNQGCKSAIPGPMLDSAFLAHYLSYIKPVLKGLGTGATFKELSKTRFQNLEIPLPPLEEQRRIAEMLDMAVTNLDNSRKSLKALNTFLPNLFESSFNRGNRTITSIGSYLAQTQYGTGAKAGESGTFPILRMGNITFEGQIDFSDLKFIDLDPSEFVKYTLKTGDILFNRTNSKDLVGKTAVYYGEEGSFAYAGYLVRCRANSNSTPEYISGYLNSPTGKAVLRNAAKSIVGMANINAKELQRLPIPEANPVEQRQWAEFEQEIHNLSGKLKKQVTLHHELYESLSTRAFTGEL